MIDVSIRTDIAKLEAQLDAVGRKELPFALALGATRTAQIVQREIRDEMERVFENPTRWTMNSLYLRAAKKRDTPPSARVWFKDFAPKGTPAGKYLRPEVFGGQRNQKRSERALQARGIMSPGQWALPGREAPRDKYGNLRKSNIVAMLSALKAQHDPYQNETETSGNRKRRGKATRYFVWRDKEGQALGIMMRRGQKVIPFMVFTRDKPDYEQRLDFFGIAERVTKANYDREFGKALGQGIASARARAGG